MQARTFKFTGLSAADSPFHYIVNDLDSKKHDGGPGTLRITAPMTIPTNNGKQVAQWAKTERGPVTGFHPNSDCNGNFTAAKYQANNNCYNYACNIATNSFAVPGRMHGKAILDASGQLLTDQLILAAEADGLQLIGDATMPWAEAFEKIGQTSPENGHVAVLLLSDPVPGIGWPGDFHFIRSDDPKGAAWSQKAGNDQIANFDFAGDPISDPSAASWIINQGPEQLGGSTAFLAKYTFAAWMYVPIQEVQIA